MSGSELFPATVAGSAGPDTSENGAGTEMFVTVSAASPVLVIENGSAPLVEPTRTEPKSCDDGDTAAIACTPVPDTPTPVGLDASSLVNTIEPMSAPRTAGANVTWNVAFAPGSTWTGNAPGGCTT